MQGPPRFSQSGHLSILAVMWEQLVLEYDLYRANRSPDRDQLSCPQLASLGGGRSWATSWPGAWGFVAPKRDKRRSASLCRAAMRPTGH
eukprot:2023307-Pleurochrysis_carterae.AAC.1